MGWYQKTGHHAQLWFNNEGGKEITKTFCGNEYKSLDALVPVWEKAKLTDQRFSRWHTSNGVEYMAWFNDVSKQVKANKIQEAAAIATAKAIQELNDE